jgi:hypothetical protein
MNIENVAAKRSKAHTRYVRANGELVPGVTTTLGVLAKPALVPWANKLGLAGIDVKNYVDVMAEIGKVGHDMICCHNMGVDFDAGNTPKDIIDKAENCLISYLAWEKGHKVEPILCEAQLVSEQYGFGGTCDMFATIDGIKTLIDYKTGRSLYVDYMYQVSAYFHLLQETGNPVEQCRILRIGRDETEGFSERVITLPEVKKAFELFLHALEIYKLQKTIRV